jgi:hypothetical protein
MADSRQQRPSEDTYSQGKMSIVFIIITVIMVVIFLLTWNKSIFSGRKRIDFTDRINKLMEQQEKNLSTPGVEQV